MRHYLGYSFIWLALQKSASPDCWYVKPVAHRLEKNVENNFSANTGAGEPKNSIKKNNNAENTSGKNLLVAVSSEKGKIASVKVNWPQHWCCSQPGTGQLYIPNKVNKSQMSSASPLYNRFFWIFLLFLVWNRPLTFFRALSPQRNVKCEIEAIFTFQYISCRQNTKTDGDACPVIFFLFFGTHIRQVSRTRALARNNRSSSKVKTWFFFLLFL